MECPYCGQELEWNDWFGFDMASNNPRKTGDIWKCCNEECESGMFDYYFWTKKNDEFDLHEGYPC